MPALRPLSPEGRARIEAAGWPEPLIMGAATLLLGGFFIESGRLMFFALAMITACACAFMVCVGDMILDAREREWARLMEHSPERIARLKAARAQLEAA